MAEPNPYLAPDDDRPIVGTDHSGGLWWQLFFWANALLMGFLALALVSSQFRSVIADPHLKSNVLPHDKSPNPVVTLRNRASRNPPARPSDRPAARVDPGM